VSIDDRYDNDKALMGRRIKKLLYGISPTAPTTSKTFCFSYCFSVAAIYFICITHIFVMVGENGRKERR